MCEVYSNQLKMIRDVNHDQLTQLGNRQSMESKFLEIFGFDSHKNRRTKEVSYCLAILDIDYFKRVNDKFGHLHGDEVLLQFARLMTKTFRDSDFLYRYGGEEFVVILADLDVDEAIKVLQRFRQLTAEYQFPLVGRVTVSIGLTRLKKDAGASHTIEAADKALYYAKEHGRNQLQTYELLVASGDLPSIEKQPDDITFF